MAGQRDQRRDRPSQRYRDRRYRRSDRNGRPFSGFDTLEQDFGWWALPETPIAHSPHGGFHIYFSCERAPDPEILDDNNPRKVSPTHNGASQLGPHIDVRGWNGQAVLPSANSGYFWDPWTSTQSNLCPPEHGSTTDHQKKQQLRKPSTASQRHIDPRAVLAESCRRIRTAPEGTRHDTYRRETFRIATMVRDGVLYQHRNGTTGRCDPAVASPTPALSAFHAAAAHLDTESPQASAELERTVARMSDGIPPIPIVNPAPGGRPGASPRNQGDN